MHISQREGLGVEKGGFEMEIQKKVSEDPQQVWGKIDNLIASGFSLFHGNQTVFGNVRDYVFPENYREHMRIFCHDGDGVTKWQNEPRKGCSVGQAFLRQADVPYCSLGIRQMGAPAPNGDSTQDLRNSLLQSLQYGGGQYSYMSSPYAMGPPLVEKTIGSLWNETGDPGENDLLLGLLKNLIKGELKNLSALRAFCEVETDFFQDLNKLFGEIDRSENFSQCHQTLFPRAGLPDFKFESILEWFRDFQDDLVRWAKCIGYKKFWLLDKDLNRFDASFQTVSSGKYFLMPKAEVLPLFLASKNIIIYCTGLAYIERSVQLGTFS